MPGIYQNIPTFVIPVANWGAAYTGAGTVTELWQGNQPYPTTAWSPTQVDSYRCYARVGNAAGTYHDVGTGWVTFNVYNPNATQMTVTVSADLLPYCGQLGIQPTALVILPLVKVPHSNEETGGDDGLNFPASLGGSLGVPLWSLPSGGSAGGTTTVYVDPILGLDTNTGFAAGAGFAWQTMGRVRTYMEAIGDFRSNLRVVCAAGPVASWTAARSNFAPEGVRFLGGARLWINGNVPNAGGVGTTNADKHLLLTGVAAASATPRDCDQLRFQPANAETWTTPALVNVALDAGDIGKTVRISGMVGGFLFTAYATVTGVDGQGAAVANRWIEVGVNSSLIGTIPVWARTNPTRWSILDHQDPDGNQVTAMAGTWHLMGIETEGGSALQTDATTAKMNCISNIRFTANIVTLENCDRFALPGCRFEAGIRWIGCRDCSTMSNAVSDAGSDRYFPDAQWTFGQGFAPTVVGTADAFGGQGFFNSSRNTTTDASTGIIRGMVVTIGNPGNIDINNGSNIILDWGSFGPDGANILTIRTLNRSGVIFANNRLTCKVLADETSTAEVTGQNSWLARAINLADDVPVPATAATHVLVATGMMQAANGGEILLTSTTGDGSDIEGINGIAAVPALCVLIGRGCKFTATGGHGALLYGNYGWLEAQGGSICYLQGTRTFAVRTNSAATEYDIYGYNCTIQCGADDVWTKNGPGAGGGDAFPAPFIYLDHHANFKHGTPITQNPIGRIVMGADGNGAAGAGVACSAAGAIVINDGSHATISDPRINNETGPAIVLLNASFLHFANTTAVSFLENVGAAAAAFTQGSIATVGYLPAGGDAHRAIYSDYLLAIGTSQGTFARHE